METTTFDIEWSLNMSGAHQIFHQGYIGTRMDKSIDGGIKSEDHFFNLLISLSEYSFGAFKLTGCYQDGVDGNHIVPNEKDCFNNLFHYDYSNDIDYTMIYSRLANPLIKSPTYDLYCAQHKNTQVNGMCIECLERYRIVTRNLIYVMRTFRKDLCSIYFIDILYQLIRFENRDVYSFITYAINHFADGSSFKSFAKSYGTKKIKSLLKKLNRPFRRCDFKLILKKYLPVIYNIYLYSVNQRLDCLDKVYDYMLLNGMSMFKNVPTPYIVVGYEIDGKYRIDIIKSDAVMDHIQDCNFQIASHTLLEGINFGFYEEREKVYHQAVGLDKTIYTKLKPLYMDLEFSGASVFTNKVLHSKDFITIGFLKPSENTYQNYRLDIHIPSIISNGKHVDKLRFIKHDKWQFEDNESDEWHS